MALKLWNLANPHWVPPQAEVCSGTVADVLQSVVGGADGCIFSFGHMSLGKCYHPCAPVLPSSCCRPPPSRHVAAIAEPSPG